MVTGILGLSMFLRLKLGPSYTSAALSFFFLSSHSGRKLTLVPGDSACMPSPKALRCTKTSSPPSEGEMKPKPFWSFQILSAHRVARRVKFGRNKKSTLCKDCDSKYATMDPRMTWKLTMKNNHNHKPRPQATTTSYRVLQLLLMFGERLHYANSTVRETPHSQPCTWQGKLLPSHHHPRHRMPKGTQGRRHCNANRPG